MRVLFTVFPGTGHFHPLVPLARALESAGHQVAFATLADGPAQSFAAQVVAAGFVLLPVGSMDKLLANPEVQQWRAARAADRVLASRVAITRMFPEVLPCALLADLVELADRWNPDLIVSDNFEFAGRVVAESREVPHASLKVSEFFSYPDRHTLIPQMDVLRAGVGLPPDPDAEMQFRYMYLVDDPPGFDSGQILPPTTVRLRRTIFDGSVLPDWLSDLAPRPTVYATAGTNVNSVTGVLERLDQLTAQEASESVSRIRTSTRLEDIAPEADFVVEAIAEDLAAKQQIFRTLDGLCLPHTILASTTSSLLPSSLAAATRRADRVLVTHYFNPPAVVPLVEVVRGPETSDATVNAVRSLLTDVGKRPAVLEKELLGFIANRLQAALFREAFALVARGAASPSDIDAAVKYSFGGRRAAAGLFEMRDLAGLEPLLPAGDILFPDLDCSTQVPQFLRDKVARGEVGVRSGQGFYSWTPESAAAVQERIARVMMELARS